MQHSNVDSRALYIMIGGFLGAGKTTAVAKLAAFLTNKGKSLGLITNDQASNLVDTRMLRSRGFMTEEIAGGCFCCKFNSLMEAADRLSVRSRPDIFIAEPVGSCTDLVATVTYPLRRIYGDRFVIAPLSVVVDPIRAMSVLGLDQGKTFSEKVVYIYLKQLEEADILVINKSDLLSEDQKNILQKELLKRYPKAVIFLVSSRSGEGLEPWFDYILSQTQSVSDTMEVDYQVYAEGEALLGWLNCTIAIRSLTGGGDGNELLQSLGSALHAELLKAEIEVAHLKMTLAGDGALTDTAVVNLVRNTFIPELSQRLEDPITSGEIILNLRAEADPALLKHIVEVTITGTSTTSWQAQITHLEHFRPGKPVPTHRVQQATP